LPGTGNFCSSTSGPGNKKNPAGFTLVEVLIVFLVASVLLLVAVPQLAKALEKYSVGSAARQLAEDIRDVQQQALNEESSAYFLQLYPFDPAGDWYEIKRGSESLSRVKLPRGVDMVSTTFSGHSIFITARGTITAGGTVTFRARAAGDRFKYVIVSSITGRVRVSDSPPESWEK
jgi:prepilin-type N-terminal cleavage/methylation domain-containing protein